MATAAKWGHSPKSWGNGGNIPLFPGLGGCVGMGGMPIFLTLALDVPFAAYSQQCSSCLGQSAACTALPCRGPRGVVACRKSAFCKAN
jgi:hypothetical protein